MNKYATAAVSAAQVCIETTSANPVEVWEDRTSSLFEKGSPAQTKGCPRDTFLALCGAGLIGGIPEGEYTRSKANASYALRAVEVLAVVPELADDVPALWKRVMGGMKKRHNSQMNVVVALWKAGLITFTQRRPQ